MARMKRQTVTLQVDVALDATDPADWRWADLLDEPEECVRVVSASALEVVEVTR